VDDILALIADTYRSTTAKRPTLFPGQALIYRSGFWASSGGESATVAGNRGLRFAANYHVAPAAVLEATDAYRLRSDPRPELDRPTSRSRRTSSSPRMRPALATSLRVMGSGCAASAPLRVRSL